MARIAVDAMGGDNAPHELVAGALQAARDVPGIDTIYLVGDEQRIREALPRGAALPDRIELMHCTETVGMDEAPAVAIRRKKDSSIARAVELVKDGKADAVFSAGNTGAAVAATTLKLRTLQGVARPAIATVLPTQLKPFVLLDAGANLDCSARMLAEFAVMGAVYSKEILHQEDPVVGLLSIGEEDAKGNEVTKEAFRLLEASPLNFKGNVESRDLFEGRVDVGVCDGFVGNVVLKTSESVAKAMSTWVKEELGRNFLRRLGAFISLGAFRDLKRRADPAAYGGAPLLGVNGVCIIGHGSSSAHAVRNAIRVAEESVEHHLNPQIVNLIEQLQPAGNHA